MPLGAPPRITTWICILITIRAGRLHLFLQPVKSTTLIQIIYIIKKL
ncbi:hypothetical protein SAMN04487996_107255 [Dyadobacter soli]|uniref:Uncharacterized protein n=1 Tax=Dyadobacter soli TaxID=659014 RepID=A0A1G7GHN4_9BACT|nr:hypothetical protein SAMN04487996_107255 [Dyadobacter soli]